MRKAFLSVKKKKDQLPYRFRRTYNWLDYLVTGDERGATAPSSVRRATRATSAQDSVVANRTSPAERVTLVRKVTGAYNRAVADGASAARAQLRATPTLVCALARLAWVAHSVTHAFQDTTDSDLLAACHVRSALMARYVPRRADGVCAHRGRGAQVASTAPRATTPALLDAVHVGVEPALCPVNQCDPQTGQCKCKAGWVGAECDRCAPGHFGPRCRPCLCDEAGTRDCQDGVCSCDDEGRCPCKENVVGDKCDECLDGTFGLSADNPSGCTACFCFGRAAHCTQAAVTRAALHAASAHHVTVVPAPRNMSVDENSPIAIPIERADSTIAVPYPPLPVYVDLDKRFLGDRVTSYGGALRFTVEEEGGEELTPQRLAAFPLVRLEGNGIELNHYQLQPAKNGTYAVRFHESLWMLRGPGLVGSRPSLVATRPVLMAALQRVDRLLLRVTSRAPTARDHVHALSVLKLGSHDIYIGRDTVHE
ncbi:unnamed protein product [Diatraea saccharalis]|uniref:Uncharacterized protein n=1 Tax=Diatraea saccharalis TaxID=40085 RepID=A0A9N9QWL8_9NEOP|nr:unnamed protein product [Diatraea saccharalis]